MISRLLALALILCVRILPAQDEGTITKKARVLSKSTTLLFAVGPSFNIGSGDYSGGFNVQAGLLKRLNRIVSIGPVLSLTKFNYDKSAGNTTFIETGGYEIWKVQMQGGDLTFSSLGLDIKFNFIPSERIQKFSPYAIVMPVALLASRSQISAKVETWYRDDVSDNSGATWYYSGTTESLNSDRWEPASQITAGLNAGIGADLIVSSGLSLFLQSTIGLALPINYVDSKSHGTNLSGFTNKDYPFAKKSFSSLAVSVGVAYTF